MKTENKNQKNKPVGNVTSGDSIQSVNTVHYRGKTYSETPVEKLDEEKYFSKPKNHIEFREFYY